MEIINYTLKCTHSQLNNQAGHALLNHNYLKFRKRTKSYRDRGPHRYLKSNMNLMPQTASEEGLNCVLRLRKTFKCI